MLLKITGLNACHVFFTKDSITKKIIPDKKKLFADPNLLYKEDRDIVNSPFYFKGTNGKGVLLIHGWTSTPYEVRLLGEYLHENGYTVIAPQLRGHGTVPKDLENVRWCHWMEDIQEAYQELRKDCGRIFVGGSSIGSNLAIHFAGREKNIAGLILLATPYKLKNEKLSLGFARILKMFKKYHRKIYPPTSGLSTSVTRLISYQRYPIKSALEIFDLIKKSREIFPAIRQPCILLQSTHDHIVARDSLEQMYADAGSEKKVKKYVNKAYHSFISDIRNKNVFEDIFQFIEGC